MYLIIKSKRYSKYFTGSDVISVQLVFGVVCCGVGWEAVGGVAWFHGCVSSCGVVVSSVIVLFFLFINGYLIIVENFVFCKKRLSF
ncbi:MAG: hypothetical protein LBH96_05825, partial [Candidatus Peribacteria bacterium]|nr:hypothetical protein [Candidatus Peribacteria bacterium]